MKRRDCEVIIDPRCIVGNVSVLSMANHRDEGPEVFDFIIDRHMDTVETDDNELYGDFLSEENNQETFIDFNGDSDLEAN